LATAGVTGELGLEVRCHSTGVGAPPLFIEPAREAMREQAAFLLWLQRCRPELDRLIVAHGGIVLRGFPVVTTADFEEVIGLFPAYSQGYVGGITPRKLLGKKALESTTIAPQYRIGVHQEMAYTRDYPPRIMFFARIVPEEGGQTIIADMRQVTNRLPADLAEKLDRLGVAAVRNFGNGEHAERAAREPEFMPWMSSFGTDDRAEVERLCRELGREAIWNANGSLTTVARFPAFVAHPQTGKRVYRANLHAVRNPFGDSSPQAAELRAYQAMPSGNYFGDGTPLNDAEWASLAGLVDAATREWPWHAGDVMILDNLLVGHGRNPFHGVRETQVALLS
jgi:alpha-ketoglutarate-dependent taurine dioxygenase